MQALCKIPSSTSRVPVIPVHLEKQPVFALLVALNCLRHMHFLHNYTLLRFHGGRLFLLGIHPFAISLLLRTLCLLPSKLPSSQAQDDRTQQESDARMFFSERLYLL